MNGYSEQQQRPAQMLARRGGRLVPNPRYHLPLRPRLTKARRSGLPRVRVQAPSPLPSPSPSPSPDAEPVDAGGRGVGCSTLTEASRANGISARQSPAAFRIAYPHGRCAGRGCQGVCGGACRPEPCVKCHCPQSNEEPWPRLCMHCKDDAAIRDRAVQRFENLQQQQRKAVTAE